ncbi:hypothetical protein [Nonomuraea sp. NPDC003754]
MRGEHQSDAVYGGRVANAMMYWPPLCDPVDADPLLRKMDVPRRCRILADAYGMSDVDGSSRCSRCGPGERGF